MSGFFQRLGCAANRLFGSNNQKKPWNQWRLPLRLELLEDRSLPSTFLVSNLNDAGAGSLRNAIIQANTAAGADTINFKSGLTGTITLTTGQIDITDALVVNGPGAKILTVSGNNASRIFSVVTRGGQNVAINGLTLTKGNGTGQSSAEVDGGEGGAIIATGGNLTVQNSVLTGNTAGGEGGAVYLNGGEGGASLTINRCTISNNQVTASEQGGGVAVGQGGNVTILNSTLSGNITGGEGGAVGIHGNANVTIQNSTISGNSAKNEGGGVWESFSALTILNSTIFRNQALDGGGVFVEGGTATLRNTIVAGNTDDGGPNDIRSSGGTLNARFCLIQTVPPGTINGTNVGNIFNRDPRLGPLANNGGPTQTHALLAGSPALDAGDPAFAPPPGFDQRGSPFVRVFNGRVDIGAFEFQPVGGAFGRRWNR